MEFITIKRGKTMVFINGLKLNFSYKQIFQGIDVSSKLVQ